MQKNIAFYLKGLGERLWFRPLIFCLLSIAAALLAPLADRSFIRDIAPDIERSSVEDLLTTLSSTMLVIAIFAVGAMLSAFSAASNTATPRSFTLIISDDLSQNALSAYIGSFIYSIVASISLKNGYYGEGAYFTLFILTLLVFVAVIFIFVRWVDRISKLGRLSHTIQKVEAAATRAFKSRLREPLLGGVPLSGDSHETIPLFPDRVGYVQYIQMDQLQSTAEEIGIRIRLNCLPGSFLSPNRPLLYIMSSQSKGQDAKVGQLARAFVIEDNRSFLDDPRFGLIALSEIASRALSPGINDPGTAIAILNSHVRVFSLWVREEQPGEINEAEFNRVEVPALSLSDMFEDAFRPIARDGAGNLEVMIRLQKSLAALSLIGTAETKNLAAAHARDAFERAKLSMKFPGDLDLLRQEVATGLL